jgi:hypothetical protein
MPSDETKMTNAIHADNQRAHDYAGLYMDAIIEEFIVHAGILTIAMQKYAAFLELKALPNRLENYANMAFTVLSLAAPELFLVKFLGEEEKTVKAALAISSALGNKTAKVMRGVQQAHEIGEKVHEITEKAKSAAEKASQTQETLKQLREHGNAPPGMSKLAQFDAGRAAVNAMADSLQKAHNILKDALTILANEYEAQLDNPKGPNKESLEGLAMRLLRYPTPLTDAEKVEIETLYLYETISAYVKDNVIINIMILDSRQVWGVEKKSEKVSIENLNDNQQATIIELFARAKRGRIFYAQPIYDVYIQVKNWGAKQKTTIFRHGTPVKTM